ncbi:MAG: transglutaminase family protein [Candidatus Poribacteria bacterium]|nr:transglutaminase family protein [Candidatus Poribacteria bacterium]
MKFTKVWISSFVITMTLSTTGYGSIKEEFARILTLSESEKRMMLVNEPYSYENYITFALIASGVTDREIPRYKKIVDKLVFDLNSDIETKQVSSEKDILAEFILGYLHRRLFHQYFANQTKINKMLENRRFNCVSSSVLYTAICRNFGINITGLIVPDHVLVQLRTPTTKIDIETTIRYGFDPASKKEVLDHLGKITGFVYVDQKNYKQRSEISDRQMISLIYSNRYKALNDQRRHAEATRVLYAGWQLAGNLPRTLNTWENGISNYIISLDRLNRFSDALYVIDLITEKFPTLKQPTELHYNIYLNWSYHALKAKQFELGSKVAQEGLKTYPRDRKLLQNLKSAYVSQTQALVKKRDFNSARLTIETAKQLFPNENSFQKLGVNLVVEETKELPIDKAVEVYRNALKKYPRDKVLQDGFAFLYIEPAQKLANRGNFEEAIALLDRGSEVTLNMPKIFESKKRVYNNWSLALAKTQDFSKAKLVIEKGLAIASTSKSLNANWDYVMLEFAQFEYKNNRFEEAIGILIEGMQRRKTNQHKYLQLIEGYYNDTAVNMLQQGRIQQGIDRLQAGLTLIPNSRTLQKNLGLATRQKDRK